MQVIVIHAPLFAKLQPYKMLRHYEFHAICINLDVSKLYAMKQSLPTRILFLLVAAIFFISCSRKNYAASYFETQTASHRIIAVLPAEMIFTGTKPKGLTDSAIAKIEEQESTMFQNYLVSGILRYANTQRYYTTIAVQDASTTQKLLEDNNISIRDSWRQDDKKLAKILGVDAVVRMSIQKKRYMSDVASFGIGMGQQVLYQLGGVQPVVPNKTNDIYASCNVVSNNQTLWNDHYRSTSTYNRTAEMVIEDIANNFGSNFPYRKRR